MDSRFIVFVLWFLLFSVCFCAIACYAVPYAKFGIIDECWLGLILFDERKEKLAPYNIFHLRTAFEI